MTKSPDNIPPAAEVVPAGLAVTAIAIWKLCTPGGCLAPPDPIKPADTNNYHGLAEAPQELPPLQVFSDYQSSIPSPGREGCAWEGAGSEGYRLGHPNGDRWYKTDPDHIVDCVPPSDDVDWRSFMSTAISTMIRMTSDGWKEGFSPDQVRGMHAANGLLQATMNHFFNSSISYTEAFTQATMAEIYASPESQETLYEWAFPQVKEEFGNLDHMSQAIYLDALMHAYDYALTYDHEEQKRYLERLRSCEKDPEAECKDADALEDTDRDIPLVSSYEDFFVAVDPFDPINPPETLQYDPYRKLEAWIFRRVENGDLTAEQIANWIERVVFDLTDGLDMRPLMQTGGFTVDFSNPLWKKILPQIARAGKTNKGPQQKLSSGRGPQIRGPQNSHRGHDTRGAIRQVMRRG